MLADSGTGAEHCRTYYVIVIVIALTNFIELTVIIVGGLRSFRLLACVDSLLGVVVLKTWYIVSMYHVSWAKNMVHCIAMYHVSGLKTWYVPSKLG